jgi:hypothetical protein
MTTAKARAVRTLELLLAIFIVAVIIGAVRG